MPYDPTGLVSHPDELHRGHAWKRPVRCATTANITLSGPQTIDGVAAVAEDRVLVKNQSTGSQNGLLIVKAGAWVRAFDMDQDGTTAVPAEEVMGAVVYVIAGTVNGGTSWRATNTTAPTLGTTAITWAKFGAGSVDDLTDATITAPAEDDTLRYRSGQWVNDNRRWEPVTFDPGTGPEIVFTATDIVMTWETY